MKKSWIVIALLAVLSCLGVKYSDKVFAIIGLLLDTVQPLITGFMVAYVLNILMKKLEKIYFPKRQDAWVQKTRRPVCVFGSIFIIIFAIILLILLVVPALGDSIYVLTKDIPKAFDHFLKWLSAIAGDAGFVEAQEFVNSLKIDWESLYQKLAGFLTKGVGGLFNSAFSVANVMVSFLFTGVVSLIFAIYMLFQKENLCRQLTKMSKVYLPKKWTESILSFIELAHDTFTNFISGQILEALILGSLCSVGMCILRLPYALMCGVIVGVSALIPVMGAYIGACLGAFMILTVSPVKALVFLVYLVILQQIEGNLIYPKVVGGSIGLPGIWVLAAVTVGGGILGVPGMLLGVPLTATCYKWIRRDVNRRLAENRVVRGPRLIRDTDELEGGQQKIYFGD